MDPSDPAIQSVLQILTGFVANVASDGFGMLVRRRRLQTPEDQIVSALTVQSQLQKAGVGINSMVGVAKFLRDAAANPLVYSALGTEGRYDPQGHANDDFREEVLAYLTLFANVDSKDLGACAEVLATTLRRAAATVLRADAHLAAKFRLMETGPLRLRLPGSSGTPRTLTAPDPTATTQFIRDYLAAVYTSSKLMPLTHLDDADAINFDDVYIPGELATWPTGEAEQLAPAGSIFNDSLRTVILGNPGAGKSSLMRYLMSERSKPPVEAAARIPIYIELRRYYATSIRSPQTFREYAEGEMARLYQVRPPTGALEFLLTQGRVAILFDGLDELLESNSRMDSVNAVQAFAALYPACPITVTSRLAGYREAPLDSDHFDHFYLLPFNEAAVARYSSAWFRANDHGNSDPATTARSFIDESKRLGSLRSNPLTLSLLCATYLGDGTIPRTRAELYEKCATLLFDRWDALRHIDRASAYKGSARSAVLATAAWIYEDESRQNGVGERQLVRFITKLFSERIPFFEEAQGEAQSLVNLWRGRAWIITDVRTSADNEPVYQFSHRTFLEYFTAVQLVRRNSLVELVDQFQPRISGGEWEVVLGISLAVLAQYREGGADELLIALQRRMVEARDCVMFLQFAVNAISSVDLLSSTILVVFHEVGARFLHSTVLPHKPSLYFEALRAARLVSADADFAAFLDESYVISRTRHEVGATAAPDEYEYLLLRLLHELQARRSLVAAYYKDLERGLSGPNAHSFTKEAHQMLFLRVAARFLNDEYACNLPIPTIPERLLTKMLNYAKRDWLLAAGLNLCELLSDDAYLQIAPWQAYFISEPIIYVSVCDYSLTPMWMLEGADFWRAMQCLGASVSAEVDRANGQLTGDWTPVPADDLGELRDWIEKEIAWRNATEGSIESAGMIDKHPPSMDEQTALGLFVTLAVLAERGLLDEYSVPLGHMTRRLDLGSNSWIGQAIEARLRSIGSELSLGACPPYLGNLVDLWITRELNLTDAF